jgi:hypothetical protein
LVVIEIGDDPEESGMEASPVPDAAKRKGKEKVQGSPKRACFTSDPLEYALTRATEVKLLFGRPRFILPTVMVTRDVPAKPSLPDFATLVASTTGKTEVCLVSDAGLVSGNQPPVDFETSLEPENGSGTGDRMVEEPKGHPETGAADLLEPGGGGLDQTEVLDSPEAERPEGHQPETRNPSPVPGEASTSRPRALIDSLREGLLASPLEVLLEILPKDSSSAAGTGSSRELAESILHAELQVSFLSWK